MQRIFRTLLGSLLCFLLLPSTLRADNERAITFEQLPKAVQQTITRHFSPRKVALVMMESDFLEKNYDVIFTTGEKAEFNGNGLWTKINCRHSAVPAALIPEPISTYLATHHRGKKVVKMERDKKSYEVTLENKKKVKFNHLFRVKKKD